MSTGHGKAIVLLMGPTAAGKTSAALALAAELPAALVSVDSAMVYRHMDVGTGKPEPEVLARIPHALVDIREPTEPYSAAEFRADAGAEIERAERGGLLPVLVGGTGLYFQALLEGLSALPGADTALREQIRARARRTGWSALHARLGRIDPGAAARIHPHDGQRITRALEVCALAGVPYSRLLSGAGGAASPPCAVSERGKAGGLDSHPLAGWKVIPFVLTPRERATLHERIAARLEEMLARGFVQEVARLRDRPGVDLSLPALRAVGYRQIWGHLEGEYGYDEMRERTLAATRQLARRQLTWLRGRWPEGVAAPWAARLRAQGVRVAPPVWIRETDPERVSAMVMERVVEGAAGGRPVGAGRAGAGGIDAP